MLEINTTTLQEAVGKSIKGSGRLPMLLMTTAISIELKDGIITLTTTDGNLNLLIRIPGFDKEQKFYACTDSTMFSSLVAKTTSKTIGLEVRENALYFKGNGSYNLPLIQDEEGNNVRIKRIVCSSNETVDIKTAVTKPMCRYNKLAIAKTKEIPQFASYCISGKKVYTYDTKNLCVSNFNLGDMRMLLPAATAGLLELIDDEDITVIYDGVAFNIISGSVTIEGTVMQGLDEFPVDAANQFLTPEAFPNKVELDKTQLENVLDRIGLFILPEDLDAIMLTFSNDSLIIQNRAQNGYEHLLYLNSPIGNPNSQTLLDIKSLKMIVSACELDSVVIGINNETGNVCVECGDTKFVIPSMDATEEEEFEEEQETEFVEE